MLSKVSKGYQITIPAKMRKKLGIDKGSLIDIELEKDKVTIKPVEEDVTMEMLFERARQFPQHDLTPEDLKKMDDEIYG